jgi:integrase
MTLIRVRGINRVTAKGRVYYYHRASGKRLRADPSDATAFSAEVAALDQGKRAAITGTKPASLGGLIAAYRAAPGFLELAVDTRKGYQRGFDACKPLDEMPITSLDQAFILAFQGRIYKKRGRWLANQVVTVLSIVLGWGVPRGIATSNAAAGVPKIRRRSGAPVANRAWTAREIDIALKRSSGGLRKAIALAYYAGLRKKDVVELPRSARANGQISIIQSKTGHDLTMFEAKRLSAILDEEVIVPKGRVIGATLVVNRLGKPYTRDGLDSVFEKLKVELVSEKLIRPGLTFHGLRKSLGKRAADAGFSENDIAATLGHSSPASARPYTVEAARTTGAKRVIRALDRKK